MAKRWDLKRLNTWVCSLVSDLCLEVHDDQDTFSDAMVDLMSADSHTPHERSFSEKECDEPLVEYKENIRTPTIRSFVMLDRVHQQRNSALEQEPVRRRARLTGEVFSSKGSASGRPIYEGVKGGRYYLTPSGTKVYLHK